MCFFGLLVVSVCLEHCGRSQVFLNAPPWVFSGWPGSSTEAALWNTSAVPFLAWENKSSCACGIFFFVLLAFPAGSRLWGTVSYWKAGGWNCGLCWALQKEVAGGAEWDTRNRSGNIWVKVLSGCGWFRRLFSFCAGYSRLRATFLLRCFCIRGRNVNCGGGMTEFGTDQGMACSSLFLLPVGVG